MFKTIIEGFVIFFLTALFLWTIYHTPIVLLGIKHGLTRRVPSSDSHTYIPSVSVIIPVKNGEKVLRRLLNSLLDVDYPKDRMEVLLVEDGSSDASYEICLEYSLNHPTLISCLHRDSSSGKPAALHDAMKYVSGEIIAVFDVDSVVNKDTFKNMLRHFSDPAVAAVQGRTISINAEQNMLTKVVSLEEDAWFSVGIQGRDAAGLFVPLTGSCMFIRKRCLEEVGGWNTESLAEDLDLAARLIEKGYKIKYEKHAVSYQEAPPTLHELIKQRRRWLRGYIESSLRYGRLLHKPTKLTIDAEIVFLSPYFLAFSLLAFISMPVAYSLGPMSFATQTLASWSIWFLLLSMGLVGFALLTFVKPGGIRSLMLLPLIYGFWMLLSFLAIWSLLNVLFKSKREWVTTRKTGWSRYDSET
ncbi:MAG: glycosyltransferase family 2 protein [Desulfurococcaceae archaeon]